VRRIHHDHRRSGLAVLTSRPALGKTPFQKGLACEPVLRSGCARRANGRHSSDFRDGRRFLIRVQELIVRNALAADDTRRGQVAELTVFGGLTISEITNTIDVAIATVNREWGAARAQLAGELERMEWWSAGPRT